jgi:hypothetical protein
LIILRPYQAQVGQAIIDSVQYGKGLTFSVEIARQGGKNELSAILEAALLTTHLVKGGSLIKASPTFKPQTIISMERLRRRLDDYGFGGLWHSEMGYIISLGPARAVFLSADGSASVVGHTADILLEIDESQDVSKEKYTKEFRPMGSSTNVTTVHYGTTWDDSTLLEEIKQTNLELERHDGIRRHFRYDWQEVAKYNPHYQKYVESERERLGENHPLFRTQYALLPIHGGGRFLSQVQLAQLQGSHTRIHRRQDHKIYLAGLDLAGEEETPDDQMLTSLSPRRDSTVLTIAEALVPAKVLTPLENGAGIQYIAQPSLQVVEQCFWTGEKHVNLYYRLVDILKNVWSCRRIVVDATGIGEPVSAFLHKALGSRVIPFKFTQASKSALAFNFLAFTNSGRLKLYAGDGSAEYQACMAQLEKARSQFRPNQTMNFYVDPSEGHDDFLMSLALVAEAARDFTPQIAKGGTRNG